jgi:LuxR family maltose regulon positive regulatory protein
LDLALNKDLLVTKLCNPSTRKNLVPRPRLVHVLDEASQQGKKLALISAPAGYGKTTLVAEWLGDSQTRSAWLSLDEADNDPIRFLTYLVAAFEQALSQIPESIQAMFQFTQSLSAEAVMIDIINEIAAFPGAIILALDDYHVIHTPSIHQQLAFLMEHQPANFQLVIITREDPLLPVSRLRARGQIVEIRQEELRFSLEECADFLQRVMGIKLVKEDVAALERRTEGWITGLQLAALSMQGRRDLAGFIRAFTGSSRFILDYLVEEVFTQQPEEVKDFLLKTCLLENLSGPLCDAVTEKANSQEMLEHLEQANLFIVPLDQSRVWFRYHHLFAELLHHRLRTSQENIETELHQRASRWFEAEGLSNQAIHHALAVQDWERSAKLIGLAADGLLKSGELVTLIGWCRQAPEELIRSQPEFGMPYAWALMLSGMFDEAEELLVGYEKIAKSAPVLLGQVATAQAYVARARGDNARVIEKSELALRLLPESDMVSRSVLSLNLGLVYWHEGRLREAVPALNDLYGLAIRTENHYASLTAQIFLARTLASQGALRQAEERLRETLQIGAQHPILVLAHYDLAGIYYEWNELAKAWDHVEQGLDICTRSGNVEFQNGGHLLRAILLMAQGNMLGALSEVETTHVLSQDYGLVKQSRSMSWHAMVALAMDDLVTAEQRVDQITEDVDANWFYRFIGLTKARLLLAKGEKKAARLLLEERLTRATHAGWGYAIVAIRALQAQAAVTEEEALGILAEGLKLSQPEGFIRTYVEAGTGLIPLLKESARRGLMPDYIGQILRAYDTRDKLTMPLVEPLSERELEVLRLITAGLSNREIAQELIISTGTAKTHVHNVCGKLGVRNRTEAAMRAKELELV